MARRTLRIKKLSILNFAAFYKKSSRPRLDASFFVSLDENISWRIGDRSALREYPHKFLDLSTHNLMNHVGNELDDLFWNEENDPGIIAYNWSETN
jgi:hypothetical protein